MTDAELKNAAGDLGDQQQQDYADLFGGIKKKKKDKKKLDLDLELDLDESDNKGAADDGAAAAAADDSAPAAEDDELNVSLFKIFQCFRPPAF